MATLKDKASAEKLQARTFAKKVRRRRYIYAAVSFFLVAVFPTAFTTWYLYTFAANQYATEFRFAVRGRQESAGGDSIGQLLGMGATSTGSDSFIVVDHVESLEMIQLLSDRIDMRAVYQKQPDDVFHAYWGSPAAEDLLDYWRWMANAEFDLSRGIVTAQVWSFTPEDSLEIATAVLELTRDLVDQLSRDAREEALAYANEQVASAAIQLKAARQAIQDFRKRENVIDPTAEALRIEEQISMLERGIIEMTTELETKIATSGQRSAAVAQLSERIQSTERQLAAVTDSIDEALPEQSRIYDSLQTDAEIAREVYTATLRARLEAEAIATQRQVYLSVYDTPKLAQTSLYPERWFIALSALGLSLIIWGIVYVVMLNIRDAAI